MTKSAVLTWSFSLLWLVAAPWSSGCQSAPSGAASSAEQAGLKALPAVASQTPTVHAHMAEHYAQAMTMQKALVGGDMPGFRKAAVWLAENKLPDSAPDRWKANGEPMHAAAKQGRDAATIAAAAKAFGQLGQSCAECHQRLGIPKIVAAKAPAQGSGIQPHMLIHQWAAERLWIGLITPSDEAWVQGAEALADAPLTPQQLAPGQSHSAMLASMAANVHTQASEARVVAENQRAAAYARLVQTCANCHSTLRKGPQ